jgi:AbrB family looped-hinge helix DNA binding protein
MWVFPLPATNMTAKLTLDKAGRVMIPKPLRQELHLGAGDTLQLESEGEQITLRPMRPKALLKKERGVWVYQGERTGASVTAVIDSVREKRLRESMG